MASGKTFEDLDLSREEIKRIETALKDEKFRKMFVEYAEEISNPENRKRYEEEIAMMENDRGMDVQFVNPQPGHVLKSVDDSGKKVFLNICTSDKLGTPSSTKQTDASGNRGLHWQIPHSFSPPREEFDKNKQTCMVYDVVFHPDTYRMTSNPRFKKIVEDTALEGVQKQFGVKFDYNNIKRPKMGYKGQPVATVIRSRKDQEEGEAKKDYSTNDSDPLTGMPYPYEDKTSAELAEEKRKQVERMAKEKKTKEDKTKFNFEKKGKNAEVDGYTVPEYTITHRSNLELQEFTNAPDSKPTTRPVELIINIKLPLCKSAAGVDLDIFEDKLSLKSEKPAYNLDIKLPYPVEDENGSAKFDKSKKCLVITLPVVPTEIPKMPSFFENPSTENSEIPPLIEELPPLEEVNSETTPSEEDLPPLEDVEEVHEKPSQTSKHVSETVKNITYSLPQYDFSQDIETVTFTFHVKNIDEDSISKSFPAEGTCDIRFTSLGSGGFPWHCALYMKFQDGVKLIPEHSSVDISDKNMTLTLLKSRQSRTMWDKFLAGLNEDSLEEKLFLTTANLSSQLEELKMEGEQLAQAESQEEHEATDTKPRLHVSEMNKKKLTIKIGEKPKAGYSYADDEDISDDDCPSSADIQVVHSKAKPNLHGILKQRSMSESSEDRASFSSESPGVSPRDPDTPKHVHFNSHIDKTTYKTNMSVSSMKQALKSKRRRNRKREEKMAERNGRRRHNSNGSEYSSSDEHDHRLSSESHSEDDHDKGELSDQIEATGKKVEDCGVIVEAGEQDEAMEEATPDTGAAGDKSMQDGTQTQATKGKGRKGGKKVSIAEQVKSKMAEGNVNEAVNSDDDMEDEDEGSSENNKQTAELRDENALKIVDRTSNVKETVKSDPKRKGDSSTSKKIQGKSKAATENGTEGAEQSGNRGAMAEDLPQTNGLKPTDLVNVINEEDGMHEKGDNEGESSGNGQKEEKNVVETDLSWKDGGKGGAQNEHRTECAFKFSNAVMYDLDID